MNLKISCFYNKTHKIRIYMAIYNAKIEIYEIITSEGDEKKKILNWKKKKNDENEEEKIKANFFV